MELLWEKCRRKGEEGARILRILGEDGQIEIPEQVKDCGESGKEFPVLELADYVCSAMMRKEPKRPHFQEKIPVLCGDKVESIALPKTLERIGRYGFYNCGALKKLTLWSSMEDLGAGLFTGCRGIEELDVYMGEGKSCLPEILAELNQMLRLTLRAPSGQIQAKLLIPEFFEESVENTPARILVLETHGCGHRYRYCFRQTRIQLPEYDALFPYVCVQEQPETIAELAWYRLWYPLDLSEASRKQYTTYLKEHPGQAMKAFLRIQDMKLLGKIAEDGSMDEASVSAMAEAASESGQTEAVTVLMNARRTKLYQTPVKKRKFEL